MLEMGLAVGGRDRVLERLDFGRLTEDVCRELRLRRNRDGDGQLTAASRLVAIHPVIGVGEQRFVRRAVVREYR